MPSPWHPDEQFWDVRLVGHRVVAGEGAGLADATEGKIEGANVPAQVFLGILENHADLANCHGRGQIRGRIHSTFA